VRSFLDFNLEGKINIGDVGNDTKDHYVGTSIIEGRIKHNVTTHARHKKSILDIK
jgi:hypothetical protein